MTTINGYNLVTKQAEYNGLYFFAHNIYTRRGVAGPNYGDIKILLCFRAENHQSKHGFTKLFFADIIYIT